MSLTTEEKQEFQEMAVQIQAFLDSQGLSPDPNLVMDLMRNGVPELGLNGQPWNVRELAPSSPS